MSISKINKFELNKLILESDTHRIEKIKNLLIGNKLIEFTYNTNGYIFKTDKFSFKIHCCDNTNGYFFGKRMYEKKDNTSEIIKKIHISSTTLNIQTNLSSYYIGFETFGEDEITRIIFTQQGNIESVFIDIHKISFFNSINKFEYDINYSSKIDAFSSIACGRNNRIHFFVYLLRDNYYAIETDSGIYLIDNIFDFEYLLSIFAKNNNITNITTI